MPRGQAITTQETRYAHAGTGSRIHRTGLTASLLCGMLIAGCLPDPKVGFDSPAPSKRLDAIVQASELEDDESLVKLVEKLRSHAPAERMFAIRSLEKRTGTTLEYEHAAPHWQRVEAYNRWLDWLEARGITLPEDMEPIETPERKPEPTPEGSGDEQPMEMEQPEG